MNELVEKAVVGNDTPSTEIAEKIGTLITKIDEATSEMAKAKDEDTARYDALKAEREKDAAALTVLQEDYQRRQRDEEVDQAISAGKAMRDWLAQNRKPAKSIGGTPFQPNRPYQKGELLYAVHEANAKDYERQAKGKQMLAELADRIDDPVLLAVDDAGNEHYAKAATHQDAWGEASIFWGGGKSTLGTTDATGGWIIPNAVVDEFIVPASYNNIYRQLMTVVPGVQGAAVDIPFRAAARARAVIAAYGATKENRDLAYQGYTATMYTLAAIYDIGNQFLRQSRGAAEADVLSELAAAFAAGESYYIREGSGSSEPFGYTPALTNGPGTFRTTNNSPSDSTLAGSIAAHISMAAGALAGRGVTPDGAVLSAAAYWQMLRQGSDEAGFWFSTVTNTPTSIRPGTLISPFGIPVYPDAGIDSIGTAAVQDNLVVAQWKKFKVYFGQSYRVDSSDEAGTRWDTNLTGFRGEEEMGFDARPAVYAGYAQMITDILP